MGRAVREHEDIPRAVAGLSWVLLLFGLLYLIAAAAPDSGMYWDVERQSTTAWIGIGSLTTAVPVGVVALVLDRHHRVRDYAPGESRAGIRHPVALAAALASAALTALVLTVIVARAS
ncbi:hypothetical protein SAMN05660464_2891 [Geodermatophilus dictyosporus]|uniref:Uncharacterized protein n=1 Tax=Geodermatophilus dictyosporus TaxID=1523247 RepID=A0A1I5PM77_9ACTN|nr:hypothetical protein [Geodermatophilus dictyosporus]SFP35159.1 hypothetical protein SAMN05660464_2891 [Geodermatophilus dictyosporus]